MGPALLKASPSITTTLTLTGVGAVNIANDQGGSEHWQVKRFSRKRFKRVRLELFPSYGHYNAQIGSAHVLPGSRKPTRITV